MSYIINEKLKKLKPYQPETGSFAVRLDANESYFNLPENLINEIAEAVKTKSFNRYPDPYASKLCNTFAAFHNISAENVVAGNGSDELISLIFQTFLTPNDRVLLFQPDFSMYRQYADFLNIECVELQKDGNFEIDIDKAVKIAQEKEVRLIIFSNPCNPTSKQLSEVQVKRLLTETNALVVLDEAYMEFSNGSMLQQINEYDNLIVLRTLSKAFSGATLRLGFAVSNKILTNILKATKSPYNVNGLSQTAGEILLKQKQLITANIQEIKLSVKELYEGLKITPKLKVIYPNTNFVSVITNETEEINHYLRSNGVCVRNFRSFLRITAGNKQENQKVLTLFKEYYENSRD